MSQLEAVASIDNTMETLNKNANHGSSTWGEIGPIYGGGAKTVLFRQIGNFDLTSIPGGSVVTAAKLRLEIHAWDGADPFGCSINRCTRPSTWTEMGCTWNKYDGTNNWTAEGGDYSSSPVPPVSFVMPLQTGLLEVTGLGALCQDAIDTRSGVLSVIVKADSETGATRYAAWYSSEHSVEAERWRVIVDYDPPAGAPSVQGLRSLRNMGERRPREPVRASRGRAPSQPTRGRRA